MDYKKLIKSRNVRIKIMQSLSFVPDKWMVQLQYRMKTGRKLNLKNPQRFTEKLQWYKLYYRDPVMKQCVDKADVREYVKKCGLEDILNEIYGVYENPEEIDFDNLPNQFVLKDTLGGGGNSVIIVADKSEMNKAEVMEKMRQWVSEPINKKHPGREWVYDGRKHRILIEEYIPSVEAEGGLIDYKFFCFGGKAEYTYVIADRKMGDNAGLGIYVAKTFQRIEAIRCDEEPLKRNIDKPACYEKMLEIAERLSHRFPEARIDLYNADGQIRFSEITFFDGSGYMTFEPDEFDYEVGGKWYKQTEGNIDV